MTKVLNSILVEHGCLHPNDWNPNEQSDHTFNELVQEIREEGFGHPLSVVPIPEAEYEPHWDKTKKHYRIIGGYHRWRAAAVLEMTEIPCFVHEEWDEVKQKLKTVRDNLLSGKMNPKKFTDLVRSLDGSVDRDAMQRAMGFESEQDFSKFYIGEKTKEEKSFLDSLTAETKTEKFAIDSLSDIVSTLFATSAATIDQNYLAFTYKGKAQVVVLCDKPCLDAINKMLVRLKETGQTATNFVTKAVEEYLEPMP